MDVNLSARFAGEFLFGDQAAFSWNPLVGGPASVDEFLGNAPGTTTLANQGMVAASGSFTGPSPAAVRAGLDTLASYAGLSYPLGLPTGQKFPFNYVWYPRPCYFIPAEFMPGTIVAAPGNMYTAAFKIVLRETS